MVYSVLSSILSVTIIRLFNLIIYSDVTAQETKRRIKILNKLEVLYIKENCKISQIKQLKTKLICIAKLIKNRDISNKINKSNNSCDSFNKFKDENISMFYSKTFKINDSNTIFQKTIFKSNVTSFLIEEYKIMKLNNFKLDSINSNNKNNITGTCCNGLRNYSFSTFLNLKNNKSKEEEEKVNTISSYFYTYYAHNNKVDAFNTNVNFKMIIKLTFVFVVLLGVWIYLIFIITDIYINYNDNLFKVCIMPLVSTIIINMCIVTNVMIFISTSLLFYNVKRVRHFKLSFLKRLVYNMFVPITADDYFESIKIYKNILLRLKD